MGTRVKVSGPGSGGETVNRVGYGPITRSPQVCSEEAGGGQARRSTCGLGSLLRGGGAVLPHPKATTSGNWAALGCTGPGPHCQTPGRGDVLGAPAPASPFSQIRPHTLHSSGGTWLWNTVVIAETYTRSTGSSHRRRVCKAERRVQPSPERPPRAEGFRSLPKCHPKPDERSRLLTAAGPTDGLVVNR